MLQCCSAAVLQYRGGDEAAISIMDTQRQSASGTQYCSDPIQSCIGAPLPPLPPWGHLLMTQSYIEMVVLDGVVMVWPSAVPVASVLWCRDQGVTRIMDNSVRIATDKHRHYSLYYFALYLEQIYQEYDFIFRNFERLNEFLFVFSFSRRRGGVWKVRFSLD